MLETGSKKVNSFKIQTNVWANIQANTFHLVWFHTCFPLLISVCLEDAIPFIFPKSSWQVYGPDSPSLIVLCNYAFKLYSCEPCANNNSTMTSETIITWQEVAKHNTDSDLWIVIDDKVYNVSEYQLEHPGGPIVLMNKAGKHASLGFQQASHSKNAIENVMPKYRIGKIDPNSTMSEQQKQAVQSTPNVLITVIIVILILAGVYSLAS